MVEEFEKRVQKKIDELTIREREAREVLDAILTEKAQYLSAASVWALEMKSARPSPNGLPTLDGMGIAEAAQVVMKSEGGQMRVVDLVRQLRLAGATKAKGNGAYSSVLKTLQRKNDVFREVETGKWALI